MKKKHIVYLPRVFRLLSPDKIHHINHILEEKSLRTVLKFLKAPFPKGLGLKISYTTLQNYNCQRWANDIIDTSMAIAQRADAILKEGPGPGHFAAATMQVIEQKTFEYALDPNHELPRLTALMGIIQRAQRLEIKRLEIQMKYPNQLANYQATLPVRQIPQESVDIEPEEVGLPIAEGFGTPENVIATIKAQTEKLKSAGLDLNLTQNLDLPSLSQTPAPEVITSEPTPNQPVPVISFDQVLERSEPTSPVDEADTTQPIAPQAAQPAPTIVIPSPEPITPEPVATNIVPLIGFDQVFPSTTGERNAVAASSAEPQADPDRSSEVSSRSTIPGPTAKKSNRLTISQQVSNSLEAQLKALPYDLAPTQSEIDMAREQLLREFPKLCSVKL